MQCQHEACLVEKLVERVESRLDKMESKIDDLMAFKWKVIGGATLVSVAISLLVSFINH